MIKKIFVHSLLLGCLFSSCSQAAPQGIYIDSSFPNGGTGSQVFPYNQFTDINWFTVQQWVDAGEIVTINLKRGSVWRERLNVQANGTASNPIIIQDYGSGEKPQIYGSQSRNNANDWTEIEPDKWEATGFPFTNTYPENNPYKDVWADNYKGDIAIIAFIQIDNNEEIISAGYRESGIDQLDGSNPESNDLEYIYDPANESVVVYSSENPALRFDQIEVGVTQQEDGILLMGRKYITIKNIVSKYNNRNGINIRGLVRNDVQIDTEHITIDNCEVYYAGGRIDGGAPFGNGIQMYYGVNSLNITNSTVSQVWDAAIAVEATSWDNSATNIIIENNDVSLSHAGIEFGAKCKETTEFVCEIDNLTLRNNTISNLGYGWSGYLRGSGKGSGIIGTLKRPDFNIHSNITIEDNYINTYTRSGIILFEGDYVVSRNYITNGDASSKSEAGGIVLHGGGHNESVAEVTGLFQYNVIANNVGHGIYVVNNAPAEPGLLNVFNNTLYNNGTDPDNASVTTFDSINLQVSDRLNFKSNIVYSTKSIPLRLTGRFDNSDLDNNIYFLEDSTATDVWVNWTQGGVPVDYVFSEMGNYLGQQGTKEAQSLADAPLFIDKTNGDFHLSVTSPAIDNGFEPNIVTDYDGYPIANLPDVGAFEFQPDTDSDGLTDNIERCFDGDCLTYDPYNASSNPQGGDLDINNPDTDGDGFNDSDELSTGSNPIDIGSIPALGDINNDGVINAADILLVTRIVLGTYLPTNGERIRGDLAPRVTGNYVPDGQINTGDVLLIMQLAIN